MSLPHFHIRIDPDRLRRLQSNVWSDRYIPASLVGPQGRKTIRIRYRGNHTRDYPKKSYDLVMSGRTYHLNAEYDDPSLIRNALSFRFFEMIGVAAPKTLHCVLYVNGVNQGVYLLIEAVKRSFFARRGIPIRSLVYAVNDRADFSLIDPDSLKRKRSLFDGYRLIIGTDRDRRRLKSFIRNVNTLKGERFKRFIGRRLDFDQYLHWLAGAVLTGNYDGFDQNYALYEHGASRRYRIVPWDYEGTWGRNCFGKRVESDLVRIRGYNALTKNLLSHAEYRKKYKKLLARLLDTAFTKERIMPIAHRLYNQIREDVYRDVNRKWPISLFESEPRLIEHYLEERRRIIKSELNRL